METPDVLIVGGGIIGCSLARELARVLPRVVVVERGLVGCGSSSAAAGILSPALATTPSPVSELSHASAALYEEWVRELAADGGGEVGFQRNGILEAWLDAAEAEQHRQTLAENRVPGRLAEWLTPEEFRTREPAVKPAVAGALFYPDGAQVDAARLTRAVATVAERAGVEIREQEPVQSFELEGEYVAEVRTANEKYRPGVVVITAGAWSSTVLEAAGISLPGHPVKGQVLLAECRVSPVRVPLFVDEAVFVPRPDGTLALGVTVEDAGFDERVTLDGLRTILNRACALVPTLGSLRLLRVWAGLRPATPDEAPYMGLVPPLRNLWVSTGHFRKGILLAPLCARWMAQSILAGKPIEELKPFQATRRVL